jgi:CheY-like chemotaxis protein
MGSEFIARLPVSATPVEGPRCTQRLGEEAASVVSARRLLIVDDNVDAAEVLGEALRVLGFDVRVAFDGPAALAAAASFRPELALLDLGLPVMDGYELALRLRELCGPCVPLVAITGYGQEADRERSRCVGFREHLVKPVELDLVRRVIMELLTQ